MQKRRCLCKPRSDATPTCMHSVQWCEEHVLQLFSRVQVAPGDRVMSELAPERATCDPYKQRCQDGHVCINFRPALGAEAGLGQCVRATARFVPSYSLYVRWLADPLVS